MQANTNSMIDKLQAIKDRFEEVGQLIVQPDTMADMKAYSKLNKEYKDLEKIVNRFDEYQNVLIPKNKMLRIG